MVHSPVWIPVAVALALTVLVVDEAAAQGAEDADKVEALVRSGLAAGLAGDREGRRDKLEAARVIDPSSPAPHWHLGHVRVGGEWKTIAEAEKLALTDAKLEAYLKQRVKHAGSVEGQARLAAWCQRNGLADQSRAHWYQVLRYDPNGKPGKRALVALDATWYRGTLLTKEQAEHQRQIDEGIRRELKGLKAKIRTLRDAVLDSDKLVRAFAMAELKRIRGDVGVVAITQVLLKPTKDADQTVRLQTEAMKLLGTLDSSEAVRILSWHAARSPHERIREVATKELTRLPIYEYVPVLLAGMKMPIEVAVTTRVVGSRTATNLSVSREGPAGQLYEDQLQSYQSIGGSPTIAFEFGTLNVIGNKPTRLVNM